MASLDYRPQREWKPDEILPKENLQQYEYCELIEIIGGPITKTKGELYIFRANKEHVTYVGDYGQIFAALGLAGWELIGSSARIEAGLTNKHKINYIFRRKI